MHKKNIKTNFIERKGCDLLPAGVSQIPKVVLKFKVSLALEGWIALTGDCYKQAWVGMFHLQNFFVTNY